MPVRLLFPVLMALCLFAFGCAQPPPEMVEVPVTVEVLREVPVTVEVEREVTQAPITVEKIVEVPVTVEVSREVPVTVEVEREVTQAPITVEKIVTVEVEKEVQAPVDVEVTREVTVEVIREVTREVTVEVTREVTVVKNNPTSPTRTERLETPIFTPTPTDSQECRKYLADVQQYVDFVQNRYDAVAETLDQLADGKISDNAAESKNRSLYTEIRNESANWNLIFSRNRPPEIFKAVSLLAINFSFANIRLMNAVFDAATRDEVIQERARTMAELLLEIKMVLADPPVCG